jgi:hypothetical protein
MRRSVVLRDVDAARRCIEFYTDARSPKLMQVQSHPRGTLVLWSEPTGWQLRLRVQLEAQLSGLSVSSRWARLKMTPAAHDYLSPLPPGSRIAAPGFDRGSARTSRWSAPRCSPSTGWSCMRSGTGAPCSSRGKPTGLRHRAAPVACGAAAPGAPLSGA